MLSYLPVFKEIRYGWYYFRNRNLQYKFRFNQLNLVKLSLGKEILLQSIKVLLSLQGQDRAYT